jgi:Tol biopolymer transport system component
MPSNRMAKAMLTVSVAAAAVLGPTGGAGAARSSTIERTQVSRSVPGVVSSVSSPGGVLAYVSDSDYYGTDGKEKLATVSPGGAGERTLLAPTSSDVGFGLLEFSPSGQQLAFFHVASSIGRVEVMDVATRKVIRVFRLLGTTAYLDGLAWTPGGRDLIVGSNERPGSSAVRSEMALWRVPLRGGKPKELTSFEDAGDPAVLPDGDLVYVVSKTFSSDTLEKSSVWTSGPSGTHPDRLFTSTHFVDSPSVSPGGRTLAFSVVVTDTTTHLETLTLATRHQRSLTPVVKDRTDISPSFSPNGSEIVFLSSRAGRHATTKSRQLLDAYVMTATGKNPRKVIARAGDKWSMVLVSWGQ